MGSRDVSKKDWNLFRSKSAGWQETYMDRLTKEYIELLSSEINASEKFWTLEKRIKADKRRTGVRMDVDRTEMIFNLMDLLDEGAITMDDLEEFSDDLKERMQRHLEIWK